MRALEALLARPEIAQVRDRGETGRAGTDHHHATAVAGEYRGRDGVFAGMFEDDAGTATLAQDIPDGFAELPCAGGPLAICGGILPMRHQSPVGEVFAIDAAFGPELDAELGLGLVADHADWDAAGGFDDL